MKVILDQVGIVISVLSMSILFVGVTVKRSWANWAYKYLFVLLVIELSSFVLGVLLKRNDYILLVFSSFAGFVFLTQYYSKNIKLFNSKIRMSMLGLGVFLFLISFLDVVKPFIPIILYIYSVSITTYSLLYFYKLVKSKIENKSYNNMLNYGVLFFFCLDTCLSIASKFLTQEVLIYVSWFWFVRVLFLQFFYITLINYLWKTGKVQ